MRVAWWLVQVVCLAFGLSASPVALAQRDDPSVGKGLTVPAADPTTCSWDAEGVMHFAIGLRVYRQPTDNLIRISGRAPQTMRTLPPPPKLEEPEGCPDCPVQDGTFTLVRYGHTVWIGPDDNVGAVMLGTAAPCQPSGVEYA